VLLGWRFVFFFGISLAACRKYQAAPPPPPPSTSSSATMMMISFCCRRPQRVRLRLSDRLSFLGSLSK
jgi:hypothetical protein